MAVTEKIKYADIDEATRLEWEARRAKDQSQAILLAQKAVADLQQKGILDENRRRVRKDIPAEMRDDSDADMSAF